jgi:tetratricopeptide (TPR) repeat protein
MQWVWYKSLLTESIALGLTMPLKKKRPMPKSAETRIVPRASKAHESKNGEAGPVPKPEAGPSQMESFEEGMHQFHARRFQPAGEFFLRAMRGPDRAVAHRAGLHARICEQRLASAGPVLNTPEEHYNYAVTLINSRDLAPAQEHLRAALEADAAADHVLYALAACQSMGGDLHTAYENLKRAIDLQPRNRLAARQDPDFAALAGHPAFHRLLYPDKKTEI